MKYLAKLQNNLEYKIEEKKGDFFINGEKIEFDWKSFGGSKSLIQNNKSYNIDLISFDSNTKEIQVCVNQHVYSVKISDQYDLLLKSMNLNYNTTQKIKSLKAPMPGLILKVHIKEGQEVQKGDSLLVLEAMKMENIIKAPADLTIKQIHAKSKEAVEKDQTLIEFA